MASLVQVKLECNPEEKDSVIFSEEVTLAENLQSCQSTMNDGRYQEHVTTSARKSFPCPVCPRTYTKKQLCELHVKKAHSVTRSKERCEICGVRFINLQAHKEKYHYFVDVDRCSLCGKVVKYLSSHHCPLQDIGGQGKESKMECPSCGNLVKQKYLKIHQKNHCVGIRTSTFTNFRASTQVFNICYPIVISHTCIFSGCKHCWQNSSTNYAQTGCCR